MNLGQIRTRVSIELGIRADSAGEVQTLVTDLANEAVLEILKRAKIRVTDSPVSTILGVGDYDLPREVLRMTDLMGPNVQGEERPFDRVSPDEIRDYRRYGNSDYSSVFAVDGFNLLMIWPTPSTAYTLKIYYVPRPVLMSQPADDPETVSYGGIPSEYHSTILSYIYAKMGAAGDDGSSQMGGRYMQEFENAVTEMRRRINYRPGGLGPARVAPRRRRRPVLRPDQA